MLNIDVASLITEYINNPIDTIKLTQTCKHLYLNSHYLTLNNYTSCNTIEKIHIIERFNLKCICATNILNSNALPDEFKEICLTKTVNDLSQLYINIPYQTITLQMSCTVLDLSNYDIFELISDCTIEKLTLPKKLKKLTTQFYHSAHPIALPDSLTHLNVGRVLHVTNIPSNLTWLKLSNYSNLQVKSLLKLKHFEMNYSFIKFVELPPNLIDFEMGGSFNVKFELTSNLIRFIMGQTFNQPIDLPNKLEHFKMGASFNQNIILSPNLKWFKMGHVFNNPIVLLSNLEYFYMGDAFDQFVELPASLKFLRMGLMCNPLIKIPKNVIDVEISSPQHILKIPDSVKTLYCRCDPRDIYIPQHVEHLLIRSIEHVNLNDSNLKTIRILAYSIPLNLNNKTYEKLVGVDIELLDRKRCTVRKHKGIYYVTKI